MSLLQIGEVAERVGLSLRSIRYYEEMRLVVPADRSAGGFRLYADADVDRLLLIKRMKPLGFPLEAMRDLLEVVDALDAGAAGAQRAALLERLAAVHAQATERAEKARRELGMAEEFATGLGDRLEALSDAPAGVPIDGPTHGAGVPDHTTESTSGSSTLP
ncbi:MerR family transcriptional regulator [Nocardioides bruguierae]|uniref:MerR family transcriptional regulator n=1 Tax=Nocardioides bruguierae TaxID=2945102 RepID=UPI0020218681|nr:MerR family transcriptional regulator [Nocardioides bruguierae]MCL8024849.1 MerR family transcriptional regulator [Nocardioides bruguierae]